MRCGDSEWRGALSEALLSVDDSIIPSSRVVTEGVVLVEEIVVL